MVYENKAVEPWDGKPKYTVEKHGVIVNILCGLHGFSVKPRALCPSHERKT